MDVIKTIVEALCRSDVTSLTEYFAQMCNKKNIKTNTQLSNEIDVALREQYIHVEDLQYLTNPDNYFSYSSKEAVQ